MRWENALAVHREIALGVPYMRRDNAEGRADHLAEKTAEWEVEDGYPAGGIERIILTSAMESLLAADPVYVSEDVAALWEAAWPQFKPEPLKMSDVPQKDGIVLLPREMGFHERTYAPVRAWSWHVFDVDEDDAPTVAISTWALEDDYPSVHPLREPFLSTRRSRWVAGRSASIRPGDAYDVNPYFQAFWRLMQQVVAVPERLPRARRREEKRHGSDRENITILRLRRAKRRPSDGTEPVAWDHRWMVRGHWRNQWYPSLNMHRQIWVSPHVKGPDDKPLVVTDRVVEFVR